MVKIRQQIVKWQRQHSTDKVARLKETEHSGLMLSVKIICLCVLSVIFVVKDASFQHIFLSNWTSHVVKCVENMKTPLSMGK